MKFRVYYIVALVLGMMMLSSTHKETKGKASYYAPKFEGRKTSSGEPYRAKLFTAAHKHLPLGTYVQVTNLANDSVVVVKVNDRLHQKSASMIDLSYTAAQQLNFIRNGIAQVHMRALTAEELAVVTELKDSL